VPTLRKSTGPSSASASVEGAVATAPVGPRPAAEASQASQGMLLSPSMIQEQRANLKPINQRKVAEKTQTELENENEKNIFSVVGRDSFFEPFSKQTQSSEIPSNLKKSTKKLVEFLADDDNGYQINFNDEELSILDNLENYELERLLAEAERLALDEDDINVFKAKINNMISGTHASEAVAAPAPAGAPMPAGASTPQASRALKLPPPPTGPRRVPEAPSVTVASTSAGALTPAGAPTPQTQAPASAPQEQALVAPAPAASSNNADNDPLQAGIKKIRPNVEYGSDDEEKWDPDN